jgi:hypothetical protein
MVDKDVLEQGKILQELIELAQTPEQIEFLSNWNGNNIIIDASKMQEALRSQREQIKRLEYDMIKEEQIYLKVIRSISSGEERW